MTLSFLFSFIGFFVILVLISVKINKALSKLDLLESNFRRISDKSVSNAALALRECLVRDNMNPHSRAKQNPKSNLKNTNNIT